MQIVCIQIIVRQIVPELAKQLTDSLSTQLSLARNKHIYYSNICCFTFKYMVIENQHLININIVCIASLVAIFQPAQLCKEV